ncbi:MAG: T9SS type A sorting domain-containing protein [Lewinella sp.]
MKILSSLLLLFIGGVLMAQPDCTISDSLYNELDAQATQILLNEMVAGQTAADSPIEFDSSRRTQYLSALFAVHQLEDSPERDTVIDLLRIQPFPLMSTRSLRLFADTSLNWMVNLRAGNPSANPVLDSMLASHGLEVTDYDDFFILNSHRVKITSSQPLNTPALAEAFKAVMPELNFAEPDAAFGDGDNIEMIPVVPDGWRVRYSAGSGDCPSGCIFRTNYDFEVEPVCTQFEILQDGGTATRQVTVSPLGVYPVPFIDEITPLEINLLYTYQMFDVAGRMVKASLQEQRGAISGLGDLPAGWYVLRVRDQGGKNYQARIIK